MSALLELAIVALLPPFALFALPAPFVQFARLFVLALELLDRAVRDSRSGTVVAAADSIVTGSAAAAAGEEAEDEVEVRAAG